MLLVLSTRYLANIRAVNRQSTNSLWSLVVAKYRLIVPLVILEHLLVDFGCQVHLVVLIFIDLVDINIVKFLIVVLFEGLLRTFLVYLQSIMLAL